MIVKRIFDFLCSLLLLIFFGWVIILCIFLASVDTFSFGLFTQQRIGQYGRPFLIFKIKTMNDRLKTISMFGKFLRKSKLDELPQLFNVLLGDMSLVGPRPNLFNQEQLMAERYACGVYNVRPGITGLAQINKIDMSTPQLLAEIDGKMTAHLNVWYYF